MSEDAVALTVGDLTPRHVGQRVRITSAHAVVEGQLRDLRVDTAWIEVGDIGQHPDDRDMIPGRQTATVAVGEWMTDRVPLGAEVEVLG